jgi:hypothetical protein
VTVPTGGFNNICQHHSALLKFEENKELFPQKKKLKCFLAYVPHFGKIKVGL